MYDCMKHSVATVLEWFIKLWYDRFANTESPVKFRCQYLSIFLYFSYSECLIVADGDGNGKKTPPILWMAGLQNAAHILTLRGENGGLCYPMDYYWVHVLVGMSYIPGIPLITGILTWP